MYLERLEHILHICMYIFMHTYISIFVYVYAYMDTYYRILSFFKTSTDSEIVPQYFGKLLDVFVQGNQGRTKLSLLSHDSKHFISYF
jgi:hypothetical protein